MKANVFFLILFIHGSNGEDLDSIFYHYVKTGSDDYKNVIFHYDTFGAEDLNKHGFDQSLPVKIFIHGFNDLGEHWFEKFTEAYNDAGQPVNLFGVDWRDLAKGNVMGMFSLVYPVAAGNTDRVGEAVAKDLGRVLMDAGIDAMDVHLIGHSLGSHVASAIGRGFRTHLNRKPGRISGLDPAKPLFDLSLFYKQQRLSSADAELVEVIHTNAGVMSEGSVGLMDNVGHVDFWPDHGEPESWVLSLWSYFWGFHDQHQAGCHDSALAEFSDLGCSHRLAVLYFLESIRDPLAFSARPCRAWEDRSYWWVTYQTYCQSYDLDKPLQMGENLDPDQVASYAIQNERDQIFFLSTNPQPPYSRPFDL